MSEHEERRCTYLAKVRTFSIIHLTTKSISLVQNDQSGNAVDIRNEAEEGAKSGSGIDSDDNHEWCGTVGISTVAYMAVYKITI